MTTGALAFGARIEGGTLILLYEYPDGAATSLSFDVVSNDLRQMRAG